MEQIEVMYDYTILKAEFINDNGDRIPLLIGGRGKNYSAIPLHKLLPTHVQPILSAWLGNTLQQMEKMEVPLSWRIILCLCVEQMMRKYRVNEIYVPAETGKNVTDFIQAVFRYFHPKNQLHTSIDGNDYFDVAVFTQVDSAKNLEKYMRPGGRIICLAETQFYMETELWEEVHFFKTKQGVIQTARLRVKEPGYFGSDAEKRKQWNLYQEAILEVTRLCKSLSLLKDTELDMLICQIAALEEIIVSLYEDLIGCDDIKYRLNLVKEAVIRYRLAEKQEKSVLEAMCHKKLVSLCIL